MAEVFAFVNCRPCGCACQAATIEALPEMMKNKHFRESMKAGKIRSIMTREEWNALPWKCAQCEKPAKKTKSLFPESASTIRTER